MESADIVDMIATGTPSSEVSDAIKDLLYVKSSAKVDAMKPSAAQSLFDAEAEVEEEPLEDDTVEGDGDGDEVTDGASVEGSEESKDKEETSE